MADPITASSNFIPLAAVIENLRAELLKALEQGRGQVLQFRLKPIELEVTLGITTEGKGEAGVKFWVVELGASGSYEKATTHRLKLTLDPIGKAGEEVTISSSGIANPMRESE